MNKFFDKKGISLQFVQNPSIINFSEMSLIYKSNYPYTDHRLQDTRKMNKTEGGQYLPYWKKKAEPMSEKYISEQHKNMRNNLSYFPDRKGERSGRKENMDVPMFDRYQSIEMRRQVDNRQGLSSFNSVQGQSPQKVNNSMRPERSMISESSIQIELQPQMQTCDQSIALKRRNRMERRKVLAQASQEAKGNTVAVRHEKVENKMGQEDISKKYQTIQNQKTKPLIDISKWKGFNVHNPFKREVPEPVGKKQAEKISEKKINLVGKITGKKEEKSPEKVEKKSIREVCRVCFKPFGKEEMFIFSKKCQHSFCTKCIKDYVSNKITEFKEIKCLNDNCSQLLDVNSSVIQDLPIEMRQKYYKILIFYEVNKHPHQRLCPKPYCQGYVITNIEPVACVVCDTQYCSNCMMKKHGGKCDENGIQFLQKQLNFKRCKKCLFVVERDRGCVHITCRCGHQFCFMCGGDWSHDHLCKIQSNPVLPPPPPPPTRVITQPPRNIVSTTTVPNQNTSNTNSQRTAKNECCIIM